MQKYQESKIWIEEERGPEEVGEGERKEKSEHGIVYPGKLTLLLLNMWNNAPGSEVKIKFSTVGW